MIVLDAPFCWALRIGNEHVGAHLVGSAEAMMTRAAHERLLC